MIKYKTKFKFGLKSRNGFDFVVVVKKKQNFNLAIKIKKLKFNRKIWVCMLGAFVQCLCDRCRHTNTTKDMEF